MTNFAQRLNELLAEQPERPVDIAKRAGITQDELTKYKNGKRFPMQREKVTSLLMAIRCSVTVREEIKNIWEREYLAKKYKEEDAWKCIKEIYQFFQSESLVYDQNSCVQIRKTHFGGGVLDSRLNIRKYLESFLCNHQEDEIKIWGSEKIVEKMASFPLSKETQYLHLIHAGNVEEKADWIHTVCSMLLRMLSCPKYKPMVVYGNSGWTEQLFSSVIISKKESVMIAEDEEQGMIVKDPEQIQMLNHYFTKISGRGKPIAILSKQGDWYKTEGESAIFMRSWIELDRISKRKGIYYITAEAVQTFSVNGILWDCFKNIWYQYKSIKGKKDILESILEDADTVLIDDSLFPLRNNFSVEFCQDRFLCILVADREQINHFEVCEPELVKWIGCALKEMPNCGFIMSSQQKQEFLTRLIKNIEKEDGKNENVCTAI